MEKRKLENGREEAQGRDQGYVTCQMCRRIIKADTCSWQEDDEGGLYCRNCMDEMNNCGCSD